MNNCKKIEGETGGIMDALNSLMSFDAGMRQSAEDCQLKQYNEYGEQADLIELKFVRLARMVEERSPLGSVIMGTQQWDQIRWMFGDLVSIIYKTTGQLKKKLNHSKELDKITQESNVKMMRFIMKQSREGKIDSDPFDEEREDEDEGEWNSCGLSTNPE